MSTVSYTARGKSISITLCEGVYEPAEDSFLLLDSVRCGRRFLEIGCGTGLLSILCAMMGSESEAVDINPVAVECCLENARNNGVHVRAYLSDIFDGVNGFFDTIAFNPPYLPVSESIEGAEQWSGGEDGFSATRRFLDGLPGHLEDDGRAFLVLSDLTDINSLIREYPGMEFARLDSRTFDFESIISYEVRMLR